MTDTSRRLAIRVSHNSLSFTTAQEGQVSHVPYKVKSGMSIAANLREALRSEPLLSAACDDIVVTADSPVLMVPANLFEASEQETLYRHALLYKDQWVVMHHYLTDLNAVAVYSIQKDIRTVITDTYTTARFVPLMASVWSHLNERSYDSQRDKLYGYFHDRRLEVFSFERNRFRFCNSFPSGGSVTDALYYLLAVWKQLGLRVESDELCLAGEMPEGERLVDEARRYVSRVLPVNPSNEFNRAPITHVPGVTYDLMTLFLG